MFTKTILFLCVQAFFIQTALSQQCISRAGIDASRFSSPYGMPEFLQASPAMAYDRLAAPGLAYNGFAGRELSCDRYSPAMEFTITSGGRLPVTSISSIAPTGITVKSDNTLEGPVTITGELPFVSAVTMEGNLPTTGAGAIDYGCGNGVVAMLSEGPTQTTFGSMGPGAYAPAPNMAFGVGSGFSSGPAMGLGNSFSPAAGFGAAGFANANRLGKGGCGCGRGMIY